MLSVKELLLKLLTTESLSFSSQYVNTISVKRYGKVVMVSLNNMKSVPNGQAITLFTLPTGWRPQANVMEMLTNPTRTEVMRATVTPAGAVQVYNYGTSTSAASTNASCVLTFITP